MANLSITLTDGRMIRHTLGGGVEVIGRDPTCEIPVDDPSTSRRHARFTPAAGGYVVDDLGSKNGTLVNDTPSKSQVLRDGDEILIGSVLVVYSDSQPDPASSIVISRESVSPATRYITRDQKLNLPQQRLEMIYELSERLTTLQDRESLLDNAMDICFETLRFERGAIGVRRRDGRMLDWPVVRNLRGSEGELTISHTLLNRALQHGERAILADTGAGNTDPTVSMVQHGIRSAMCVPLHHRNDTIGVIYGDRISTSTTYSTEDIDFLAGIAQQVSVGLINCRLLDEQRETARLQRDIDLARTIQKGLLPASLPRTNNLRIAALNEPGLRVSGDYYDVIELDDGRVWCLVADVTGEGPAAALLMANLQAAVRVTATDTDDPAELLSRWNHLVYRNTDSSKFITCVLALVEPDSRRINFAAAGHCPPLLVRSKDGAQVEEVDTEATFPLGIVDDAHYTTTLLEIGPDPALFFCYTDGVVEALEPQGGTYGLERLVEVLGSRSDLSADGLVKQVRKSVAGFAGSAPQSDDITILAARIG